MLRDAFWILISKTLLNYLRQRGWLIHNIRLICSSSIPASLQAHLHTSNNAPFTTPVGNALIALNAPEHTRNNAPPTCPSAYPQQQYLFKHAPQHTRNNAPLEHAPQHTKTHVALVTSCSGFTFMHKITRIWSDASDALPSTTFLSMTLDPQHHWVNFACPRFEVKAMLPLLWGQNELESRFMALHCTFCTRRMVFDRKL